MLGYRNGNNSRVRAMEALIRSGAKAPPVRKKKIKPGLDRSSYARAFLTEYIFRHSQSSPADTILYVDHMGTRNVYTLYSKEIEKKENRVSFDWFARLWARVLGEGVTDSETGTSYDVCVRHPHGGTPTCITCTQETHDIQLPLLLGTDLKLILDK